MFCRPRLFNHALWQADGLDKVLELLTVYGSAVLYLGAVVVDGVDRIVQELGYLGAVVDAEAYQGEDAYARSQLGLVGQRDAAVGLEELVELVDKRREEAYERGVEYLEQLLLLLVAEVVGLHHVVKLSVTLGLEHGEHVAAHGIHAVYV